MGHGALLLNGLEDGAHARLIVIARIVEYHDAAGPDESPVVFPVGQAARQTVVAINVK